MNKTKLLALLLPVQIILINILALFPSFIEQYYSMGIFPYLSRFMRILLGYIPFSIGDIIYGIVLFLAIRWLWRKRKSWKKEYKQNLLSIAALFSIIYFVFNASWALNYHRVALHKKLGIEKKYTEKELILFTERLIYKANEIHFLIAKNDSAAVAMPSLDSIYMQSPYAYKELEKKFPFFAYNTNSIKSSLISAPLSYMGFGGYLNPFTNEAQVNNKLPLYNLPTTTCHEMAHQIGYASESEANFIGYMASIHSKNIYFQYSGYTFALKYCLANIKKLNEPEAKRLLKLVSTGIQKNYAQSEAFNKKYESAVEDVFKYVYDNFLKINKQKDGLEGYSKFTGLLVNYYKDKNL
ncbi:amino acid permease [Flavobacterium akiainvivens]|uniref:Amino acid permease n=1 Tax=Flavobacterium akiainvivens TaxID=1202724 RepID=A0A0M8MAC3_9FLAO|nr:DUF3810 domain-containing protein [Flavobacterium akiainvivens]KOS05905.1 amino acid permease [Flavobacterium akiainvivens]SFQ55986.1 Protein of unknown function [Flavobacterium akiainvivens]